MSKILPILILRSFISEICLSLGTFLIAYKDSSLISRDFDVLNVSLEYSLEGFAFKLFLKIKLDVSLCISFTWLLISWKSTSTSSLVSMMFSVVSSITSLPPYSLLPSFCCIKTALSKNLDRLFSYIVFWALVEKSVLVFKNNHKKVNNLVSLIRAH